MTTEEQIESIKRQLQETKDARDRMLQHSFSNPTSFEAKNREILMRKFVQQIRGHVSRLKKLRRCS